MKHINNTALSFKGQNFYIGIDTHKKQWTISINTMNMMLGKTLSIDPTPMVLKKYLSKHYPEGHYFAVYEAGFSGFTALRELKALGIECIVIHPADVPTSQKEKLTKNDKIDSKKLARSLANNALVPLYIPNKEAEEYRFLNRYRFIIIQEQTRIKNRIKAYLHYFGISTPQLLDGNRRWSGAYIHWIETVQFETKSGQFTFKQLLEQLEQTRTRLSLILKEMRDLKNKPSFKLLITHLTSIPGIGFITAMTFACEIIEMKRFNTLGHLASYVGLVPSVQISDEKERISGISIRRNKYLRKLLVEAAWIAVKKDPALTMKFAKLSQRMNKNKAIIRIAKILLSRIRHVWINQEPYAFGLVK